MDGYEWARRIVDELIYADEMEGRCMPAPMANKIVHILMMVREAGVQKERGRAQAEGPSGVSNLERKIAQSWLGDAVKLKMQVHDLELEALGLKVRLIEQAIATETIDQLPIEVWVDPHQFERWRSAKRRTAGLEEGVSLREVFKVEKTYGDMYIAKLRADTKAKAAGLEG